MSKLKNRSFLLRLSGTLLAIILLIYLLNEQGWAEIIAAIRQISWLIFLLSILLMIVSRFAVTARWHVLLRACGLPVRFSQTTRITFAGLFATNFLPTTVGGDVVRLAGAIRLKFDAALSAASLIADRLVGMFGMALVLPLGLPAFYNAIVKPAISAPTPLPPGGAIFAAAAVALPWRRRLGLLWDKTAAFLRKMGAAMLIYLRRPKALALSLLYTTVHMACLFTIFYVLFLGEGEQISWGLIAGLYSIVYFVTLIPVSINGYGLQEISITLIFSKIAGVSLSSSLSVALLFRTIMMLVSLPGAFFVSGIVAGDSSAAPDEEGVKQ